MNLEFEIIKLIKLFRIHPQLERYFSKVFVYSQNHIKINSCILFRKKNGFYDSLNFLSLLFLPSSVGKILSAIERAVASLIFCSG